MTDERCTMIDKRRLRQSMRRAIDDARRREAKKPDGAPVDVSHDHVMTILERQGFVCALSGLPFWIDPTRFHPSSPSIDRVDAKAGYVAGNIRIIWLGINGLRGNGTDETVYRAADALLAYRKRAAALDLSPAEPQQYLFAMIEETR